MGDCCFGWMHCTLGDHRRAARCAHLVQRERHTARRLPNELQRLNGSDADAVVCCVQAQPPVVTLDLLNYNLARLVRQDARCDSVSFALV